MPMQNFGPSKASVDRACQMKEEMLKRLEKLAVNLPANTLDQVSNLLGFAFFVTGTREYLRGKYHCTVDLLFDWFGLVCFANKNKNCL